jgi:uridine kinase
MKRDIAERGRDMRLSTVIKIHIKPMHEQFIRPTKAFADIIIQTINTIPLLLMWLEQ